MSIETVRLYLKFWGRDQDIIEMTSSTATVLEASSSLGCIPARIAKSIALSRGDQVVVVVIAGDMKLDNRKYKDCFGVKARMLSSEEALRRTGHAIGGVCPFGLPSEVEVYLDSSLKRFEKVFPACGSSNSAIELTVEELNEYAGNKAWVDVCRAIGETGG